MTNDKQTKRPNELQNGNRLMRNVNPNAQNASSLVFYNNNNNNIVVAMCRGGDNNNNNN